MVYLKLNSGYDPFDSGSHSFSTFIVPAFMALLSTILASHHVIVTEGGAIVQYSVSWPYLLSTILASHHVTVTEGGSSTLFHGLTYLAQS